MYQNIIDPINIAIYDVKSNKGTKILKKYITQLVGGSLVNILGNISLGKYNLSDKKLEDPKEISTWWSESGCLIYVVRRPGWLLCREQASDLSALITQLKINNERRKKKYKIPKLCAIVGELIDIEGFAEALGENGEIFLDEKNVVKHLLSPKGTLRTAGLGFMISPVFWKRYNDAQKKYPDMKAEMNSQDGLKLGGVLLVNSNGGLDYIFLEKDIGSHANLKKIKKIILNIK